MTIPVLPTYDAPYKPVPQVTPLTYRDNDTLLKKLDWLKKYINRTIVPFVNENMEQLGDDFEEQVNLLIAAVNAAIQAVINSSIVVQDPVVATLVNDDDSATREALDAIYASITALNAVEVDVTEIQNDLATRLADVTLDAKYLNNVNAEKKYGRVLRPEMYGAVGDGVTDDSAAFNALILDLSDGDRVVGDSSRVYAFFTPISLSDLSNIHWEGGRYKFIRNTASANGATIAFKLTRINDSLFENMYLEQFNQTPQYTGISINESSDIVVRNVHTFNFRWIGLAATDTAKRIEFIDCVSMRCRFGGYSNGADVKFIGGRYSSEWSQTQEFIDKGGVWDSSSLYYDGIIIGGSDWVITGVTLDDNGQSGVYGGNSKRGILSNCVIFNNWNKGVDFGTVNVSDIITRISVIGNTVKSNKTGDIHFKGVITSAIIGNMIETTEETFGVGLNQGADSNVISGNTISSTATSAAAVFLESTGANPASNNIIRDNIIGAASAYSVDAQQNILYYHNAGSQISRNLQSTDLSAFAGFAGRAFCNVVISDDNTAGQFIINKAIEFADGGGSRKQIRVGGVESTAPILTQRGNTASRPTAASAGSGAMYYDNQIGKPIWSNGANWKDAAGNNV